MKYASQKKRSKMSINSPQNSKKKLKDIAINQMAEEPHNGKKLIGDLTGFFSTRLSYKDRIVYSINEEDNTVTIHRAKTHYGD